MTRLHRIAPARALPAVIRLERGQIPGQQQQIEHHRHDRRKLVQQMPAVALPAGQFGHVREGLVGSVVGITALLGAKSRAALRGNQGRNRLTLDQQRARALQVAEKAARALVPCHGLGVGPACGPRQCQTAETGGLKIFVENSNRRVGDHVAGRVDREARDRQAARQRLEQNQAERIGAAGKHEHVRARVDAGELLALAGAEEGRRRIALRQFLPGRPVPHHDLAARQVERQKGLDVLLHRQASDREKYRSWQPEIAAGARLEQIGVDAARPAHQLAEAAPLDRLLGQCESVDAMVTRAGIVEPA